MSTLDRETIVCFSSQRWRDKMWTNKQHIMSRIAKEHDVVHVDHGLRPLVQYLAEKLWYHTDECWPPHKLLYDGVAHEEGNLHIGDGYAPIWTGLLSHSNRIRDFFTFDMKVMMARNFVAENVDDAPIAWVYHPGFGDAVDKLDHKLLVYDCVDNYEAFPFYGDDTEWLKAREERLCRAADVVFCTSQTLYDDRKEYNPDNTYLVHNVGDAAHFKTALDPDLEVAEEIAELDGPVVGFVGAVSDYKLNIDWVCQTCEARPDWNFVIIGPVGVGDPNTDVQSLKDLPNVHLLGHRDYQQLPRYLKGVDTAVIPYRINSYTESVFPIKFFEYLATGKPVVISNLPSLSDFYDTVEVARDGDQFIECCERAMADDDQDAKQRRIELAEKHSWPERVRKMMERVEERL